MKFLDCIKNLFSSNSFEKKVLKIFDRSVREAMKDSGGEALLAGVFTYAAIGKTYDSLKHNFDMQRESGLNKSEYDTFLREQMHKIGRKYLSNWDQMQKRNEDEMQQRLEDEAIDNMLASEIW